MPFGAETRHGAIAMTFDAAQFTPTKWDTAKDKAAFAEQFVRFVESEFDAKHFTDKFYRRLSNTFGHIAHYDRGGFWTTFFTTIADKVEFLKQTHGWPCYGDPAWTYCDVERALQAWLRDDGTLERYRQRLAKETERAERDQLACLQAKYGNK
jgi:hypothetical protein